MEQIIPCSIHSIGHQVVFFPPLIHSMNMDFHFISSISGCFYLSVKTNNKSDDFPLLSCHGVGSCWLVELQHGLTGLSYTTVCLSTKGEFAGFRHLWSCFLNHPRWIHFKVACLLHTPRGPSSASSVNRNTYIKHFVPSACKRPWKAQLLLIVANSGMLFIR